MKKILFVVSSLIAINASAQNIRLNAYANYVFDDQVDSYYGSNNYYFDGKIKGGFQWGAGLEFMLSEFNAVELTYYRQGTSANAAYASPGGSDLNGRFDVNLNWIMLNGVRHMRKPGGKVEGWGGVGAGVCIINTENQKQQNRSESATKFAWQLRGGATIWAAERVGIKLTAQLQSAVQSVGGGFYIGTGGTGAGLSSYSSLMQFGLGGGLVFKLGGGGAAATKPAQMPR